METFDKMLNEWLNYIKKQVKLSTYACYMRLASTHILPYFGYMEIKNIDQRAITEFITIKLENGRVDGSDGLSEKTVKDMMSIINSVLRYSEVVYAQKKPEFFKWRYTNISKEIDIFTKYEQEILEKYLTALPDPSKLGIFICLYSGLRLGEICALQWKDIDLAHKLFHVRKTVQRIYWPSDAQRTQVIIGPPKTKAAIRDIPITSALEAYLEKYYYNCCMEDYVISFSHKKFTDPRTYQKKYKNYIEDSGLRYRNFHCLRHTFATRCIENGIDIKSLSEILGHSNVNITLNRYVHSSMEQKRSQLEKLCKTIQI